MWVPCVYSIMSVWQEPHYVRCIKPNEIKSPSQFDDRRCRHQVMYLGLLENVRVRRAGFAFRSHYERFLARWADLPLSTVSAIFFSLNISSIYIDNRISLKTFFFKPFRVPKSGFATLKTKFWIAIFCGIFISINLQMWLFYWNTIYFVKIASLIIYR